MVEASKEINKDQANGRNFWSLMHTVAAYYPLEPSSNEEADMKFYMENSSRFLLRSEIWKRRWKTNIAKYPPAVKNRGEFAKWMCLQHNIINEMIGKEVWVCTEDNLIKRWGAPKEEGNGTAVGGNINTLV